MEQSEELETWGDADDDKYSELLLEVLSANNAHPEWLRADDEEDEDEVEQDDVSGEEDEEEDSDDEAEAEAEAEAGLMPMAALHAKLQEESDELKVKKPRMTKAEKKKMKKARQQMGRGRRNFHEKPKKQRNAIGRARSKGKKVIHK